MYFEDLLPKISIMDNEKTFDYKEKEKKNNKEKKVLLTIRKLN